MLQSLRSGIVDETLLFTSDKALFHLSGPENAQNTRHWDTKNTIHEVPLHDQIASVWCALSAQRIIGYIFFYGTVNSKRYVKSILEPFFQMLTEEEKQYMYLQHDNASARTSQNSMEALCEISGERIINR
jgi:hypothetical protein